MNFKIVLLMLGGFSILVGVVSLLFSWRITGAAISENSFGSVGIWSIVCVILGIILIWSSRRGGGGLELLSEEGEGEMEITKSRRKEYSARSGNTELYVSRIPDTLEDGRKIPEGGQYKLWYESQKLGIKSNGLYIANALEEIFAKIVERGKPVLAPTANPAIIKVLRKLSERDEEYRGMRVEEIKKPVSQEFYEYLRADLIKKQKGGLIVSSIPNRPRDIAYFRLVPVGKK